MPLAIYTCAASAKPVHTMLVCPCIWLALYRALTHSCACTLRSSIVPHRATGGARDGDGPRCVCVRVKVCARAHMRAHVCVRVCVCVCARALACVCAHTHAVSIYRSLSLSLSRTHTNAQLCTAVC